MGQAESAFQAEAALSEQIGPPRSLAERLRAEVNGTAPSIEVTTATFMAERFAPDVSLLAANDADGEERAGADAGRGRPGSLVAAGAGARIARQHRRARGADRPRAGADPCSRRALLARRDRRQAVAADGDTSNRIGDDAGGSDARRSHDICGVDTTARRARGSGGTDVRDRAAEGRYRASAHRPRAARQHCRRGRGRDPVRHRHRRDGHAAEPEHHRHSRLARGRDLLLGAPLRRNRMDPASRRDRRSALHAAGHRQRRAVAQCRARRRRRQDHRLGEHHAQDFEPNRTRQPSRSPRTGLGSTS